MNSPGQESWIHHHLIDKHKNLLEEVRRWYLVYLTAYGPPQEAVPGSGHTGMSFQEINQDLTIHVNDLLDKNQDVPQA